MVHDSMNNAVPLHSASFAYNENGTFTPEQSIKKAPSTQVYKATANQGNVHSHNNILHSISPNQSVNNESTMNEFERLRKENENLRQYIKDNNKSKYQMYLMPKDNTLANEITRVVKSEIFKKVKFITTQQQLDDLLDSNSIGRRIISRFSIETDKHVSFWNTYKNTVRTALNSKRSEVQTSIQKAVKAMMLRTKQYDDNCDGSTKETIYAINTEDKVDLTKLHGTS